MEKGMDTAMERAIIVLNGACIASWVYYETTVLQIAAGLRRCGTLPGFNLGFPHLTLTPINLDTIPVLISSHVFL